MFVGYHTDPPDIEVINIQSRRRRAHAAAVRLAAELTITVLIHPIPGYKRSVRVKALDRVAEYEFESLIVIFMFGRCSHTCVRSDSSSEPHPEPHEPKLPTLSLTLPPVARPPCVRETGA